MTDVGPDARSPRPSNVTRILNQLAEGRTGDREDVWSAVYAELRELAERHMAGERPGRTLQATALVNEAYLRLVGDPELEWRSRRQFYAAATEAMRRILVERARSRGTTKRGGGWRRLNLDALDLSDEGDSAGILALDEALQRLEKVDGRAAEIVRLRFYAGLDVDRAALAAGVSRRTALREWAFAKAWLAHELADTPAEDSQPRTGAPP